MKYSYLSPRKKSPLTSELQLVLIFFGVSIFVLIITYTFLLYKDYRFVQDVANITQERVVMKNNIEDMKDKIAFIEKEIALSERVYTDNTVLKDSISNLFDLVPQRITLSEASLRKDGLTLYGITPNKDVYNFMLQAPLRSIFYKTYSSFYPAQNGWLNFVSTNYIKSDDANED